MHAFIKINKDHRPSFLINIKRRTGLRTIYKILCNQNVSIYSVNIILSNIISYRPIYCSIINLMFYLHDLVCNFCI